MGCDFFGGYGCRQNICFPRRPYGPYDRGRLDYRRGPYRGPGFRPCPPPFRPFPPGPPRFYR